MEKKIPFRFWKINGFILNQRDNWKNPNTNKDLLCVFTINGMEGEHYPCLRIMFFNLGIQLWVSDNHHYVDLVKNNIVNQRNNNG